MVHGCNMDIMFADETENSRYDIACEIFNDINNTNFLTYCDGELIDEETRILNMTSLNTLLLLSQTDSRSNLTNLSMSGEENPENYRLSLAYERLNKMPKVVLEELAPFVRILDISNNEFSNLNFLVDFPKLTSLICDHNNIDSNTYIPYMPKLELLWLNHCKISELYPWARQLRLSCPNLKYLSLMGNAAAPSYLNGGNFYEYIQYRLFMISLFPNLIHLDDRYVTDDQRREADRMYKRPLLERIVSKAPPNLPNYLRSVSEKVTGIFTAAPNFTPKAEKNCII